MLRLVARIAPWCLLLAMTLVLVETASSDFPPVHDEPPWLTSGIITFDLVATGASPTDWEHRYDEFEMRDWGNRNPPIGKLIIGALAEITRRDTDRIAFTYHPSYDEKNSPATHLLRPPRIGIALGAGLILVLIYLIGRWFAGRGLALIAPGLLFAVPSFRWYAVRIYTDMPQLVFAVAGVAAFGMYLHSARYRWLGLAGAFMGLSCATKFSSAPFVVGAAVALAFSAKASLRKKVVSATVSLCVPAVIFVAVNPFLYPDPIGRTLSLRSEWSARKAEQQTFSSISHQAVRTLPERVKLMTKNVLRPTGLGGPVIPAQRAAETGMLCVVLGWTLVRAVNRSCQVSAVDRTSWITGICFVALDWMFNLDASIVPLLLGMGLVKIGRLVLYDRKAQSRTCRVATGFLAMFVVVLTMTTLWLPFDWSRYYLPVIVMLPVLHAVGFKELLRDLGVRQAGVSPGDT